MKSRIYHYKLSINDKKPKLLFSTLNIPARKIVKDNVMEFWTELNNLTGEEPPTASE